jgi:predicted small metal-binding protein
MVEREYKQLSCREIGMDCDFLVRAATEDEAMRLATEHACEAHQICEITPEFRDKLTTSIRNIWCHEEKCGYAPNEMEVPYFG